MFGIAVFTALGTSAVGTAVAPTRLTLAGTIATQTPIPVGASAEPVVPEQAAAPRRDPRCGRRAPGRRPADRQADRLPLAARRTRGSRSRSGRRPGASGSSAASPSMTAWTSPRSAVTRSLPPTTGPSWPPDAISTTRSAGSATSAPTTHGSTPRSCGPTLPIVVVIDDGNGYRSIYAHFGKITVKTGQTVKAGDLLGYEGRTGHASGCHLHYGLFSPFETASFAIDPAIRAAHEGAQRRDRPRRPAPRPPPTRRSRPRSQSRPPRAQRPSAIPLDG